MQASRSPLLSVLTSASVLLPLLSLGACESPGGPPLSEIAATVNATLEPNVIVFGVGDQIDVRFPYAPTWNQTVDVAADGSATFSGIGRLIVAGMSPSTLTQSLREAYSLVIDNPELDVVVKSLASRTIYVMGEVRHPGPLTLSPDRRMTMLEALAAAEGPRKETAYLAQLLLVRWNASTGQQLSWVMDASEEYWTGAVPLYLQPYDIVFIPNTPIDDVDIWVDNYIRRIIPFPYVVSTSGP
jgi:protein involved in polysaccharide export with SLBB domain